MEISKSRIIVCGVPRLVAWRGNILSRWVRLKGIVWSEVSYFIFSSRHGSKFLHTFEKE